MSRLELSQQIGLFQRLDQVRPARLKACRDASPLHPGRLRVLVVDDSEDTRRAVSRWGERWGAAVLTAGDAPEAFRLALAHVFNLILLDLHLPALTGFDVLKGLKSIFRARALDPARFVCLSDSAAERDDCLRAGFNGFLEKPIHPPALRALFINGPGEARRGRAAAASAFPQTGETMPPC
jgi:CheY-like chemotaxis protein